MGFSKQLITPNWRIVSLIDFSFIPSTSAAPLDFYDFLLLHEQKKWEQSEANLSSLWTLEGSVTVSGTHGTKLARPAERRVSSPGAAALGSAPGKRAHRSITSNQDAIGRMIKARCGKWPYQHLFARPVSVCLHFSVVGCDTRCAWIRRGGSQRMGELEHL